MSKAPFERVELHDDARLVGARWWQESMALMDPITRRKALIGIGWTVGIVGGGGLAIAGIASALSDDPPPHHTTVQDSLAAQQKYGWSIGSEAESVPMATSSPLDQSVLDALATTLAPKSPMLRPYYVPTLLQSLTATPKSTNPSESPLQSLKTALRASPDSLIRPVEERGKRHAAELEKTMAGKAIFVDLPGPQAVAYAAGLAKAFDPVFLFDNWPHPRGVVPSHETLAAAATYAKTFQQAADVRPVTAPPVFVLDENRLLPYSDASDRFDNRYVARLPTAANLKALGITEVQYVHDAPTESDDLNADFVAYKAAGIAVHLLIASAPSATPTPYAPSARATPFSGAAQDKAKPAHFGSVSLMTAKDTGVLVGVGFGVALALRHASNPSSGCGSGSSSGRSGSYSRGGYFYGG